MTLEENIKIVLSLIDEYAPSSTNLYTEDEDIQNKIKILYNQPYQELSQIKKISKVKEISKTYSDTDYYREYSLPSNMYQLKNVIAFDEETNKIVPGDYYIIEGAKKIYINDKSEAKYKIEYYAYPSIITEETENDFSLEIDQDVQNILSYKVADNLLKSDPSADYSAFRQAFEDALNRLDTRKSMSIAVVESEYDF
jgi:hypothetical protein|nr:MAG TPA: hypothetical protein [Caudoviricetes sp.]